MRPPPDESASWPEPTRVTKLDLAFWAFHEANPGIYAAIARFAREAKAAGFEVFGIGAIYERVRWELAITTTDREFKVNDHHRSRYARLLMAREADLRGFFNLRELRS